METTTVQRRPVHCSSLRERSLTSARAAEADPRVQEVLARFPGAKVVEVRKLAAELPESDAIGEDPTESSDSDDD